MDIGINFDRLKYQLNNTGDFFSVDSSTMSYDHFLRLVKSYRKKFRIHQWANLNSFHAVAYQHRLDTNQKLKSKKIIQNLGDIMAEPKLYISWQDFKRKAESNRAKTGLKIHCWQNKYAYFAIGYEQYSESPKSTSVATMAIGETITLDEPNLKVCKYFSWKRKWSFNYDAERLLITRVK